MLEQHVVQRLAFIRYGYQLALEQTSQPEPMCAHGMLGLHDAVELFLQLAAEHVGVPSQPKQFMDYWSALSPHVSGSQLSQRIGMERLNKARVGVKHYGNLPSLDQVKEFAVITSSFFEENTPIIFGVDFSSISLVDLVKYDKARDSLRDATVKMVSKDYAGAMASVAIAYEQLVDGINDGYFSRYYRSPFYFGRDFSFDKAIFRDGSYGDIKRGQFEDKVVETIEAMQSVVQAVSLGFDYRKFAQFSLMRPVVLRTLGGDYVVQVVQGLAGSIDWPPQEESCRFAHDFVIECAIRARRVDIESLPKGE